MLVVGKNGGKMVAARRTTVAGTRASRSDSVVWVWSGGCVGGRGNRHDATTH